MPYGGGAGACAIGGAGACHGAKPYGGGGRAAPACGATGWYIGAGGCGAPGYGGRAGAYGGTGGCHILIERPADDDARSRAKVFGEMGFFGRPTK